MRSNPRKSLKAQGSRLKRAQGCRLKAQGSSLQPPASSQFSLEPRASSHGSFVVTIDGPAGVGKSTTAKLLAKRLKLPYLDTGATYRVLAYAAREAGLHPVADANRIAGMARRLPIDLRLRDDGTLYVRLSGLDVSRQIRTEEVTEAAALISQHPAVRHALVQRQRELANAHGVVVEGRDTGSIVFPDARYKFFLDADPNVRARRRQQELARLYGSRSPLAQIREQLHFRDSLDRTRRVGPLVKPRGAIAVDTTHRTASQVVRLMLRYIKKGDGSYFPRASARGK